MADERSALLARLGVEDLRAWRAAQRRMVMCTAYDFASAKAADAAGVDIVLVGDSAATTALGLATTREITFDEILMLARAVRRGASRAVLVGDLPFGTYETSDERAVASARRFAEIGYDAVKLEGGGAMVSRVQAIIGAGIAVMGHVGLTPQKLTAGVPARVEARSADAAIAMLRDAQALEKAGCFSIVFEAIPAPVSERIVPLVDIPVIGIGAGAATDGQVLVAYDLFGLTNGHVPRFVRQYANLKDEMADALTRYAADVRAHRFPNAEHTYGMPPTELERLDQLLDL